jgi:hypothetical protein
VNDSVHNGISKSLIGELLMPLCYWYLSDNHSRTLFVSVLDGFEYVIGLCFSETISKPVIKDEELVFCHSPGREFLDAPFPLVMAIE